MRRAGASALLGLLSVVPLSLASGWACVPQPFLSIGPVASGPVGAEVTVDGTDFGSGPVEIRWKGIQGPRLAEGSGPEFSVTVTIPDAPVGLHLLIGVNRDVNGNITQRGAASFQVTGAGDSILSPRSEAKHGDSSEPTDETGPSVGSIAAIAVGGLVTATIGGLVGAALWCLWCRRARSAAGRGDSSA